MRRGLQRYGPLVPSSIFALSHRVLSRELAHDLLLSRNLKQKKPISFLKSSKYVRLIVRTYKGKIWCIYHAIYLWSATDLRVSECYIFVHRD